MHTPSLRSALYVPAHRRDFLEKVGRTGADGVILDLEDSVPAQSRSQALAEVARWIALPESARQVVCVRINALEKHCLEEDLSAATASTLVAIQVPKVSGPEDIAQVEEALVRHETRLGLSPASIRIWPLLETARAVRDAYEIATCSDRIAYMGVGGSPNGDLARDMGFQHTGTFLETLFIRSKVLLDVRAAGVPNPMGAMIPSIGNPSLLETHARFIRSLGYEGMSLIHPSQVEVVNTVFGPSEQDIEACRALIRAMKQAEHEGKGAIRHDGAMIDKAHVQSAQALLAKAEEFETRKRMKS
jgi:citrate lyase subunit beta/citryl-CoA lyase